MRAVKRRLFLLPLLAVLAASACQAGRAPDVLLEPTATEFLPITGPTDLPQPGTALPTGGLPAAAAAAAPVGATPVQRTATASPTPAPVLHQLTNGGCCVQPFFSPDGQIVLYIDQPAADQPAGLWGVPAAGGSAQLIETRLGIYSPSMQYRAYPQSRNTYVERLADGQTWTIPSDGRSILFSPDESQVAWTAGDAGPPFDTAMRQVWISQVDGSQPRLVFEMLGGGLSGWFPDGRLLLNGRLLGEDDEQSYWAFSPEDGALVELARGARLRGGLLSPGGTWLAYQQTFSPEAGANGLWLVNVHTQEKRRLDLFGAYRWRDDAHLLVVPLIPGEPHRLWQVEASSGAAAALTDPQTLPFRIENGDWNVSPQGDQVIFVSGEDHNIWVLTLPPLQAPSR